MIAGLVYVLWVIGFYLLFMYSGDPGMTHMPQLAAGGVDVPGVDPGGDLDPADRPT